MQGLFIGLDAATLATLKTEFTACLIRIAVAGQSYAIGQRSFTKANLREVTELLGEITYALELIQGSRTRVVMDNFNPGFRE